MDTATATRTDLNDMIVTPNGFDVRIECTRCHESKAGSLARAWAWAHRCLTG